MKVFAIYYHDNVIEYGKFKNKNEALRHAADLEAYFSQTELQPRVEVKEVTEWQENN